MSDQILPRDNEGLLQIEDLSKNFKGLRAIYNYHLSLHQGEILGIIGPNGAGKSTLFNLITGYIPPSSGKIRFRGQDITELSTRQNCQAWHRPDIPKRPSVFQHDADGQREDCPTVARL